VSYRDASITPQLQAADLHATFCGLGLEEKKPLGLREQRAFDTLRDDGKLGIVIIDHDYFTAIWEQIQSDADQSILRLGHDPSRAKPLL
jgi:hypothetical protein